MQQVPKDFASRASVMKQTAKEVAQVAKEIARVARKMFFDDGGDNLQSKVNEHKDKNKIGEN